MNLQSMSIIFVIIFLPIMLVSTYTIRRNVDTIYQQKRYDSKLIDATTDAVSAFEINTANEDLSTVSDSLRSIIEASTNVFTTTLATNLGYSGASQNRILPYIPAIVYVLYDGYYIYSPTQQPKVVTDPYGVYVRVGDPGVNGSGGKYTYSYQEVEAWKENDNGEFSDRPSNSQDDKDYGKILYYSDDKFSNDTVNCTTSVEEAYVGTSYILKSFIPYSMQYKSNGIDVTINYTLDNYITVYGTIGDVYYSKSGYLIDYTKIKDVHVYGGNEVGNGHSNIKTFCEEYCIDDIRKLIDSDKNISIEFIDGIKIDTGNAYDNYGKSNDYRNKDVDDKCSAIQYYLESAIFSKWVEDNLENISYNDINNDNDGILSSFTIKQNGINTNQDDKGLFWNYSESDIFKDSNMWSEDKINQSNFYEHKTKVIKNSIQYNLNLAMAVYNKGQGDDYYQMPILSETEWDRLLSNISMLTFMQGFPCGSKTYNNYAIVSSSNNELMANINDIYYIPLKTTNDTGALKSSDPKNKELPTAHVLDCSVLIDILGDGGIIGFQSFPSREVKYDKFYDKSQKEYIYDHVCTTCYNCIVNRNNNKNQYKLFKNNLNTDKKANDDFYKMLYKAEKIAVGKIKNNTYKTSSVATNQGLDIDNYTKSFSHLKDDENNNENNDRNIVYKFNEEEIKKLKQCYEIDVTIKNNLNIASSISNETYKDTNSIIYMEVELADKDFEVTKISNKQNIMAANNKMSTKTFNSNFDEDFKLVEGYFKLNDTKYELRDDEKKNISFKSNKITSAKIIIEINKDLPKRKLRS